MKLSNVWNRLRGQGDVRKQAAVAPSAPAQVESFEARQLLSALALFIPATGELNLELNSSDRVRVSSSNGAVLIEVAANGSAYVPVSSIGTVPSSTIVSIVVLGGDDQNTIDLNGVTAAAFTSLTSISVDAANGNDTINGSDGNDSISGGTGNDSITAGDGDDGNDRINAGGSDGNDTTLGGGGNDVILGGDDVIDGQAGSDTVAGNQGIDVIADPASEIDENFVLSAALLTALEALG